MKQLLNDFDVREHHNENGKPQFCPFESSEILPEIVNLFCPKVGINVWLDGGSLVVESVDNRSVETYTFTPYKQNRSPRVH